MRGSPDFGERRFAQSRNVGSNPLNVAAGSVSGAMIQASGTASPFQANTCAPSRYTTAGPSSR